MAYKKRVVNDMEDKKQRNIREKEGRQTLPDYTPSVAYPPTRIHLPTSYLALNSSIG